MRHKGKLYGYLDPHTTGATQTHLHLTQGRYSRIQEVPVICGPFSIQPTSELRETHTDMTTLADSTKEDSEPGLEHGTCQKTVQTPVQASATFTPQNPSIVGCNRTQWGLRNTQTNKLKTQVGLFDF